MCQSQILIHVKSRYTCLLIDLKGFTPHKYKEIQHQENTSLDNTILSNLHTTVVSNLRDGVEILLNDLCAIVLLLLRTILK